MAGSSIIICEKRYDVEHPVVRDVDLGVGHDHPQRQGRYPVGKGPLHPQQGVAHLGPVAVGDGQVVSLLDQFQEPGHGLAGVGELLVDVFLAGGPDGVSAQGYDCCFVRHNVFDPTPVPFPHREGV